MSGSFSIADFLSVEQAIFTTRPRGFGRIDARVKLALVASAVLANVLLARRDVSVALLAVALIALAVSNVRWRQAVWFVLAPAWATALVVLGFAVGFGRTPIGTWGPLTFYQEGLSLGVNAGLRVLSEMSWAALLMLTTPFTAVLAALRWWKVPGVLVDTAGYMYRYLFLLFDEYNSMRTSARARGGYNSWSQGMASTGAIVAQVFLRALDRAERIEQAMKARGGLSELKGP